MHSTLNQPNSYATEMELLRWRNTFSSHSAAAAICVIGRRLGRRPLARISCGTLLVNVTGSLILGFALGGGQLAVLSELRLLLAGLSGLLHNVFILY